jgi:hypothetical protein
VAIVIRGTSKQTLKMAPEGGGMNALSSNARRQLQDLQLNLPRGNFDFDANALRRTLPGNGAGLGITVSPLTEQLASLFRSEAGRAGQRRVPLLTGSGAGVRGRRCHHGHQRSGGVPTARSLALLRDKSRESLSEISGDEERSRSR